MEGGGMRDGRGQGKPRDLTDPSALPCSPTGTLLPPQNAGRVHRASNAIVSRPS